MGNAQIDVCPDKKMFRQMGCRETGHTQHPTQMYRRPEPRNGPANRGGGPGLGEADCRTLLFQGHSNASSCAHAVHLQMPSRIQGSSAGLCSSKVTAMPAPGHMLCTCKCPPVSKEAVLWGFSKARMPLTCSDLNWKTFLWSRA